ncbi:G-type lectin S-receptor-like serine/threonine-protein kinase SD2-5, partial [Tanacetum coccineum]
YGMVLVEIISGRKNYAFRMMEEGKVEILLDEKLKVDGNDEWVIVATCVALWCMQDDMDLRPSMDIVVRMLEGLCSVPPPPEGGQTGFY